MGRQHGQESFILSKAFADLADPTGQCFPRGAGDYVNPFTLDEGGDSRGFAGGFSSEKKNPSVVVGGYYFEALGKDGSSSFNYFLRIEGSVTSGSFPPDPGMSATIGWNGTATLTTEGKGKGSKGDNEGSTCAGEFAISGGATITGVE